MDLGIGDAGDRQVSLLLPTLASSFHGDGRHVETALDATLGVGSKILNTRYVNGGAEGVSRKQIRSDA